MFFLFLLLLSVRALDFTCEDAMTAMNSVPLDVRADVLAAWKRQVNEECVSVNEANDAFIVTDRLITADMVSEMIERSGLAAALDDWRAAINLSILEDLEMFNE